MAIDADHSPKSIQTTPHVPVHPFGLSTSNMGLVLGLFGVLAFSFTLPLTRLAAPELGGVFVGLGRAFVAAVLAL
ncbi:MAG: hypothetical protein WKF63_07285, partial [Thermomicrobiales bacterium]